MILRGLFFTVLIGISAAPAWSATATSCGDAEKNSGFYQAFQRCEEARVLHSKAELDAKLKEMTQTGVCSMHELLASDGMLAKICADPNGFVCHNSRGRILTSDCKILILDPKDLVLTPSYVELHCAVLEKQGRFLDSHRFECEGGADAPDCTDQLRVKYAKELLKIERDQAYSPERIQKMKTALEKVKKEFLGLLEKSTRFSDETKSKFIRTLEKVEVSLTPAPGRVPPCYNAIPGKGPIAGIYNDGAIGVCLGMITQIDSLSPAALLQIMGHEISHSIDPCELGTGGIQGSSDYPGLQECLRGGTGPGGCKDGVLHCAESLPGILISGGKVTKSGPETLMPNSYCTESASTDPNYDPFDISDYVKTGKNREQIAESFADFMGAEVLGQILQSESASRPLTVQQKIDHLISIASAYSRLHGACLDKNTPDEHPPGFIRINRLVMGSEKLRKALGCTQAPQTPFAGATCTAF